MNKDSFILYGNQRECFALLSLEERGKLITALFDYHHDQTLSQELSDKAYMAYCFITSQMKRDAEKYAATCERRRLAAEKRYESNCNNSNNCNNSTQKHTIVTDNENDNENDNGNENGNENENENVNENENDLLNSKKETNKEKSSLEKRQRFLPPTLPFLRTTPKWQ